MIETKSDTPRTDALHTKVARSIFEIADERLALARTLERENADLLATVEVERHRRVEIEVALQSAIDQLSRITNLVHRGGFEVNGIKYSFHPPDSLVREAWEGLSKAIKEAAHIDAAIERQKG